MVCFGREVNLKIVKTQDLTGGEILARDIINESEVVLIPAGTVLRSDYIVKLMEIGTQTLYIRDDDKPENKENVIYEECVDMLKTTFETYFTSDDSELKEVKKLASEIIENVLKNKEVIININELKKYDEKKYSHSINVASMATLFAVKMKFDKRTVENIAVGSLLHDIGYSVVFSKIGTNLSNDVTIHKINEMQNHVIYGYGMVSDEKWLNNISKDIILCHHERCDGSGYPFHRTSENIPMPVKIVAVCDEFDIMVYQNHLRVHEAIERIVGQAGVKFDFDVVKVFNEMVAAYPIGSTVVTNTGEIGVVIGQNNKCPTRPILQIIKDRNGNAVTGVVEDLTKNLTMFIRDIC